ncbi:MAG: translation initiation factor IF-2 [Campylobacter sp.]|nr:translation initiation factor IF-2 [Campylobacter sp.]
MANVSISEIAAELGYTAKEIVEKAQEMGLKKVKTAKNTVTNEEAADLYTYVQSGELPKKSKPKTSKKAAIKHKLEEKEKFEEVVNSSENILEKTKIPKADKKSQNIEKEKKQESVKPVKAEKEPTQKIQKSESLKAKKEEVKQAPKAKIPPFPRKKGLVIVKRKKDSDLSESPNNSVGKTQKAPSIKLNAGLDAIFSNAEANLKKKKKEKKQLPVSKKESATKIEILSDHQMADISIDDEDVVVLPDFTVKPIQTEKKTTTKKQPVIMKTLQNNAYGNFDGGITRNSRKKRKKPVKTESKAEITSINIPKEIRVYEFADKLGKQPSEIISKLFMLGLMTTKNDFLDEDAIEILADEFNIEVNIVDEQEEFDYVKAYENEQNDDDKVLRAPVITIMGHVDHGKTSLLDYIRHSRVASDEAGGITQHVGAYMVEKNGRHITFIDTPGHEAFTSMRQRGANVTDIVIVVVAADDGVKPQTKEAINHAKAANVPIIIAINKMDKETANPDLVKTGLAELDILPTEWGGSYEFVPISAKTGMGVEELLEIVLLQADLLELRANPNADAKATIIESSLQKGRGPVATLIVENGTLRVGDTVVAGVAYGKVRAITDDKGKALKQIAPGECGVIIGLSEVPEAGETLIAVKSDKEAREYASKIHDYQRQKELSKSTKVSLEELSAKIAEGELKTLPVIIKTDVGGSLEAITASLEKLKNDEIKVDIIHSGVGGINQNDVALASASENCIILGFNIRPTGEVKEKAKERGVEIKTYNIIYDLIDDVKGILSGLMSPVIREEEMGQAEIRQVINVPKIGQIAGCMVTDGNIVRGAKIRVIRDGVVVFEGSISSLKRFKDDVKEVAKGYECGVGIEGYNDMKVGDYIESFKETKEKATI